MNKDFFDDINTLKKGNIVEVFDNGIWKLGRIRDGHYSIALEQESRICIKSSIEIRPVSICDSIQMRKLEMEYEQKIDFSKISIIDGISPDEKNITLGEELDADLFPHTFTVKYINELQNILNETLTYI